MLMHMLMLYTCTYFCLSFFFFKQKMAYEMRISDWSSDVCSSDLAGPIPPSPTELLGSPRLVAVLDELRGNFDIIILDGPPVLGLADAPLIASIVGNAVFVVRSEERRVGKACVRTCRFRW